MYLASSDVKVRPISRNSFRVYITSLLAVITLLMTVPFLSAAKESPSDTSASAWGFKIFCKDSIGFEMEGNNSWHVPLISGDSPGEDGGGRRVTAEEAFQWSTLFVGFYGTSHDNDGANDEWTTKNVGAGYATGPKGESIINPGDNKDGNGGRDSIERIHDTRTVGTCLGGTMLGRLANFGLVTAAVGTIMISSFTTFAFDSNLICPNAKAASNPDGCVDLLYIIGGTGGSSDGGLIGTLTSSIYMPLIVLVAVLVGVWVFYRGIVQRALREALWGVIWACFAGVAGLAFLLNPALLAKAPATVSNTLAGCVISAFGGSNCADGAGTVTRNTGSADICVINGGSTSGADGASESMKMIASSLSCKIWKAFILEPYSQASFGTNFENLGTDSQDPGDTRGKALAAQANRSNGEFCVNMRTSTPLKPMKGGTLTTRSDSICNIALYQLYLLTDADMGDGGRSMVQNGKIKVDQRWYKIADVASANQGVWNSWSGEPGGVFMKIFTAMIANIAVFFGGIVLISISIFAILYFISSIFLMAFAPLFFLIGVHPGKGRDILKGYAEMVLSNVFKYVASALFLIIALALYAGVLGASTSPGMTLLMVIVLSLALFLYRKEIVDLIGTVNMGGTQAGRSMSDKIKNFGTDKVSDVRRMGTVAAGSAVGGALATGSIKGGIAGAGEGAFRELKREGGLLGTLGSGAARGAEMAGTDNRKKLQSEQVDLGRETSAAVIEQTDAKEDFNRSHNHYSELAKNIDELTNKLAEAEKNVNNSDPRATLQAMRAMPNPGYSDFANMKLADDKIGSLNAKIYNKSTPPGEKITAIAARSQLEKTAENLHNKLILEGTLKDSQIYYENKTSNHIETVNTFNTTKQMRAEAVSDPEFQEASVKADAALEKLTLATVKVKTAQAKADNFADAYDEVRPGKLMKEKHMDEVREKSNEGAEAIAIETERIAREKYAINKANIPLMLDTDEPRVPTIINEKARPDSPGKREAQDQTEGQLPFPTDAPGKRAVSDEPKQEPDEEPGVVPRFGRKTSDDLADSETTPASDDDKPTKPPPRRGIPIPPTNPE